MVKAPGSAGLKQIYDYTDLLGFVAWLSVLVRKHKDLGLACLAQTVNVVRTLVGVFDGVGCLLTVKDLAVVDFCEWRSEADDLLPVRLLSSSTVTS